MSKREMPRAFAVAAILRAARISPSAITPSSLNLWTRQRPEPDAIRSRRKTILGPCALIIATFYSEQ
jgi:hypothetical protein